MSQETPKLSAAARIVGSIVWISGALVFATSCWPFLIHAVRYYSGDLGELGSSGAFKHLLAGILGCIVPAYIVHKELNAFIRWVKSDAPSEAAPTRYIPRISLIPLIVMVNVAGVLLWANMRWTQINEPRERDIWYAGQAEQLVEWFEGQGWPYHWRFQKHFKSRIGNGVLDWRWRGEWYWLPFDIFTAILLIYCSGICSASIARGFLKKTPTAEES